MAVGVASLLPGGTLADVRDPRLAHRLLSQAAGLAHGPMTATSVLVDERGRGGTFIDRAAIERLAAAAGRPEPLEHLSEREREILTLIAEGRTNHAIGAVLCLSPKTIECHVRAVFGKLGLRPTADEHRRVLAVLRYLRAA